MDKIRALLTKLQAIAERGEGGEKENATKMLHELMEKHGITLDEFDKEEKKEQTIRYAGKDKIFVEQIIASEFPDIIIYYYKRKYSRAKVLFIRYLTDTEFNFIKAKIDFYWKIYNEESKKAAKIFYKAFIHTNGLAVPHAGKDDDKPMTPDQMEELYKIMQTMKTMNRHSMNKMLDK